MTFKVWPTLTPILIHSGKKSWSALLFGLLYLSLHLADCVCLLCARFCATQATLYQATNVYHWYLVTYFPWDYDYHVVMKDHPYVLEFCVMLRLSFKTSPPVLNMRQCWFDWLKTQPEAIFCNFELLDFQFVLFNY